MALSGFGPQLLANHLKVTEELIARDKNRPCVALWSLANEPKYGKFITPFFCKKNPPSFIVKYLDQIILLQKTTFKR